jgi:hypothetical protein
VTRRHLKDQERRVALVAASRHEALTGSYRIDCRSTRETSLGGVSSSARKKYGESRSKVMSHD